VNLKRMNSKYRSRCKRCQSRIAVGDSIYWSRETGALCVKCGTSDSASEQSKVETRAVEIPKATVHGQEHFFTIDWADFREIAKDVVFNRHSNLKRAMNRGYLLTHLCTGESSFHGFTTGQVQRWLTEGFRTDAIKGMGDFIPPVREKRRLKFSDEGDEFHLDLAHSGVDEYMSSWTKRDVIPGVAIMAQSMFSGMVDAKVVNAYNVWICRAAFALESAGIDCQITIDFPSWNLWSKFGSKAWNSSGSELMHNIVRVKKENEATDFLSWSPMLSPAALRGFGFALGAIHADAVGVDVSDSFGRGIPDQSQWSVYYDHDRREIRILNAYMGSEARTFPEDRMTAMLRTAIEELKGN
jgi:hypothetical protein